MELVDVMLKVPKESKEVLDFAMKLAKLALKKEWNQILNLVQDAIKAGEGIDEVPAEFKSEHKPDLIAYAAKELVEAL